MGDISEAVADFYALTEQPDAPEGLRTLVKKCFRETPRESLL
jgi:hypothetical protein